MPSPNKQRTAVYRFLGHAKDSLRVSQVHRRSSQTYTTSAVHAPRSSNPRIFLCVAEDDDPFAYERNALALSSATSLSDNLT